MSVKRLFNKKSLKTVFSILLLFISCSVLNAQHDFTGLINPSFSLKLKTETPWSYTFGIANRDVVYQNEEFDFQEKFIELNHYTHYKISEKHKIGAGIRYRFTELRSFKTKNNETRLVEEYTFSHHSEKVKFAHRFRLSQRFRSIFTQRVRYRFSTEFPLSANDSGNETALKASLEPVWEFGPEQKPNLNQRLSTAISFPLAKNFFTSLGVEYQYRDYTHTPYHQLYFLSSFKLTL